MAKRTIHPSSRVLASALVIAGALVGCSVEDAPASQEADHTAGKVTGPTYAWLWANESEAEARPRLDRLGSKPVEHPLRERLQLWIDALDAAARKQLPAGRLENVPTPRVFLYDDDAPNAFVWTVPTSWSIPVRVAGAAGRSVSSEPGNALYLDNTGSVSAFSDMGFAAARTVQSTDVELGQLIEFHNEGFAECTLGRSEVGIELTGCNVPLPLKAQSTSTFVHGAVSRWVGVATGMARHLSEDETISALAHELGHYYRAHPVSPSDRLNYFYELGSENGARTPSPSERFAEETRLARSEIRESLVRHGDFDDLNALMVEHHLGFYTDEQEADEIELELDALVGIAPSRSIEGILATMRYIEDRGDDSGPLGYEECKALYERDFRDESGADVVVPVGDMSDPHHALCFRVYNAVREMRAHRYDVSASRPTITGPSWEELASTLP